VCCSLAGVELTFGVLIAPLTDVCVFCVAGAVRTTQASPAAYKGAAAAAAMGSPRQQLAAVPTAAAASSKAAGNGVFKDASSEIADIDQRLHALQNFLKMAKSSVAGA
jgi:hypothetical protein